MTLGIIGDGQLARMLVLAATRLAVTTWVLTLSDEHPSVAFLKNIVVYQGKTSLRVFFQKVDVVTFEREHLPSPLIAEIEEIAQECEVQVNPNLKSLTCASNRLSEKHFFQEHGFSVAPFCHVARRQEVLESWRSLGEVPALLKTLQGGYDGKGQWLIDKTHIPHNLPDCAFILEKRISFEQEITIIGARSSKGETAMYDPIATSHHEGILHVAKVPALLEPSSRKSLEDTLMRILGSLEYVGVLALECFVQKNSQGEECFVLNEMAPRVHNAGHWTVDACLCSQFEQHVRAVLSLPLGSTKRYGDAYMENLLGGPEFEAQWKKHLEKPCGFHLYDKGNKVHRKMGHITRLL